MDPGQLPLRVFVKILQGEKAGGRLGGIIAIQFQHPICIHCRLFAEHGLILRKNGQVDLLIDESLKILLQFFRRGLAFP